MRRDISARLFLALGCSSFLLSCLPAAPAPVAPATASGSDWPQWRGANRDAHSADTGLLGDWETRKPKLLWTADGMGEGYSSVSVANGRVYTTGNTDGAQAVIAVNIADGTVAWKSPMTTQTPKHSANGARSTPAIDGDRLYVIESDGGISCLKTADGNIVWQKDFATEWGGKMMSGWGFSESPLVDGDWVLCTPGGDDAIVVALDKLTGEEIWRTAKSADGGGRRRKGGAGYSSIVVSNGAGVKQYVQLVGSALIGVRASDGKLLWSYDRVANGTANVPTAIPIDDYIFCSSGYGTGAALLELSRDGDGVKAEEQYFLGGNEAQNHHGGMVRVGDYIYFGHGHNNGFPMCVEWKTGKIVWGGKVRGAGSGSAATAYADGNLIFRYQSGEVALIEATPEEYRLKGTFDPDYHKGNSWAHPVIAGGRLYLREQDKLMCYDLTDK